MCVVHKKQCPKIWFCYSSHLSTACLCLRLGLVTKVSLNKRAQDYFPVWGYINLAVKLLIGRLVVLRCGLCVVGEVCGVSTNNPSLIEPTFFQPQHVFVCYEHIKPWDLWTKAWKGVPVRTMTPSVHPQVAQLLKMLFTLSLFYGLFSKRWTLLWRLPWGEFVQ